MRAFTADVLYPQFDSRAARPHGGHDEKRQNGVASVMTAEQIRAVLVDHQSWIAAKGKLAILLVSMSILPTPPAPAKEQAALRRSWTNRTYQLPTVQSPTTRQPSAARTHHLGGIVLVAHECAPVSLLEWDTHKGHT